MAAVDEGALRMVLSPYRTPVKESSQALSSSKDPSKMPKTGPTAKVGALCTAESCSRLAVLRWPGEERDSRCTHHGEKGMLSRTFLCARDDLQCFKHARYGWPGQSVTHCEVHKEIGMVANDRESKRFTKPSEQTVPVPPDEERCTFYSRDFGIGQQRRCKRPRKEGYKQCEHHVELRRRRAQKAKEGGVPVPAIEAPPVPEEERCAYWAQHPLRGRVQCKRARMDDNVLCEMHSRNADRRKMCWVDGCQRTGSNGIFGFSLRLACSWHTGCGMIGKKDANDRCFKLGCAARATMGPQGSVMPMLCQEHADPDMVVLHPEGNNMATPKVLNQPKKEELEALKEWALVEGWIEKHKAAVITDAEQYRQDAYHFISQQRAKKMETFVRVKRPATTPKPKRSKEEMEAAAEERKRLAVEKDGWKAELAEKRQAVQEARDAKDAEKKRLAEEKAAQKAHAVAMKRAASEQRAANGSVGRKRRLGEAEMGSQKRVRQADGVGYLGLQAIPVAGLVHNGEGADGPSAMLTEERESGAEGAGKPEPYRGNVLGGFLFGGPSVDPFAGPGILVRPLSAATPANGGATAVQADQLPAEPLETAPLDGEKAASSGQASGPVENATAADPPAVSAPLPAVSAPLPDVSAPLPDVSASPAVMALPAVNAPPGVTAPPAVIALPAVSAPPAVIPLPAVSPPPAASASPAVSALLPALPLPAVATSVPILSAAPMSVPAAQVARDVLPQPLVLGRIYQGTPPQDNYNWVMALEKQEDGRAVTVYSCAYAGCLASKLVLKNGGEEATVDGSTAMAPDASTSEKNSESVVYKTAHVHAAGGIPLPRATAGYPAAAIIPRRPSPAARRGHVSAPIQVAVPTSLYLQQQQQMQAGRVHTGRTMYRPILPKPAPGAKAPRIPKKKRPTKPDMDTVFVEECGKVFKPAGEQGLSRDDVKLFLSKWSKFPLDTEEGQVKLQQALECGLFEELPGGRFKLREAQGTNPPAAEPTASVEYEPTERQVAHSKHAAAMLQFMGGSAAANPDPTSASGTDVAAASEEGHGSKPLGVGPPVGGTKARQNNPPNPQLPDHPAVLALPSPNPQLGFPALSPPLSQLYLSEEERAARDDLPLSEEEESLLRKLTVRKLQARRSQVPAWLRESVTAGAARLTWLQARKDRLQGTGADVPVAAGELQESGQLEGEQPSEVGTHPSGGQSDKVSDPPVSEPTVEGRQTADVRQTAHVNGVQNEASVVRNPSGTANLDIGDMPFGFPAVEDLPGDEAWLTSPTAGFLGFAPDFQEPPEGQAQGQQDPPEPQREETRARIPQRKLPADGIAAGLSEIGAGPSETGAVSGEAAPDAEGGAPEPPETAAAEPPVETGTGAAGLAVNQEKPGAEQKEHLKGAPKKRMWGEIQEEEGLQKVTWSPEDEAMQKMLEGRESPREPITSTPDAPPAE